jgi:hypothetical protein
MKIKITFCGECPFFDGEYDNCNALGKMIKEGIVIESKDYSNYLKMYSNRTWRPSWCTLNTEPITIQLL